MRGALPTLSLSNGGEAEIVGGTGTKKWRFSYTFLGEHGFNTAALDVANNTSSAINCTSGCRASNWNGNTANLSVKTAFDVWLVVLCMKSVIVPSTQRDGHVYHLTSPIVDPQKTRKVRNLNKFCWKYARHDSTRSTKENVSCAMMAPFYLC